MLSGSFTGTGKGPVISFAAARLVGNGRSISSSFVGNGRSTSLVGTGRSTSLVGNGRPAIAAAWQCAYELLDSRHFSCTSGDALAAFYLQTSIKPSSQF